MAEGFDSLVVLKSQLIKRFHHLAVICPEDKFKLPGFEITNSLDYYLKRLEDYDSKIIYHIKPNIDSFKISPDLSIPFPVMTQSFGVLEFNKELNKCRLLKSRYDLFDDGIERDPCKDLMTRFMGDRDAAYEDYIRHLVQTRLSKIYKIGSF